MIQPQPTDQLADQLAELEERAERGQVAADATLAPLQAELNTVLDELRRGVDANPFEQESACHKVTQMVQSLGRESQGEPDRTIDTAGDTFQPSGSATECVPLARLGAYELLTKLGEGGMGAVYKARHVKLDKIVAIKVLPAERMKDKLAVSRFEREMRAVGKLEHPHIVRAMDAGEAEGVHYLAMEYVQGVDLSQLVKECHPLAIADACELVRQAALGLDEAHDSGMVHRDIKPSNLMLCSVGKKKPPVVKVLDMGLALLSEAHSPEAQGLTTTGQMMGTLDYMAPEQGGDSKGVDIRADIYALGASLYKLLCGEAIYHGEKYQTPVQKMMALATQPAPSIQSRREGVPNELAMVVHRMLAKNPGERYATPAEVAQALTPFCGGANLAALLHRAAGDALIFKDAATIPSLSHPETNTSVSLGERTTPHLPQPKPDERRTNSSRPLAIAAALAGILVLAAAIVFFLQTPQGTLHVELNDPNLQVAVKGSSVVFTKDGQDAYSVAAGEKTLVVKHGEFTFETNKFELKKGAELIIKVELLPGEIRVIAADGTPLGKHPLDGLPALASANIKPAQPSLGSPSGNSPKLAPLPSVADKPVVLLRAGKTVREFKQIAGAMAELRAGDTIELRGNGPFQLDLDDGYAVPLHLRGAGGHRPEVHLELAGTLQSALKVEHCDLVQKAGAFRGPVEIAHCRWRSPHLNFSGKASLTARDSLLVLFQGFVVDQDGVRFKLDNCLVRNGRFDVRNTTNSQIELKQCTFYSETHGSMPLVVGSDNARVSVNAESCAFHFRGQMEFLGLPNWRKTVVWKGKNNLYSGIIANIFNDQQEFVRHTNAEDWQAVWGQAEENPTFVYQFEPLFVHSTIMPLAELRKVAEPVVQKAREQHQLPQLGCDWDLVGPGDAYLKAMEASGQKPAELRPEVSRGGVVSILQGGKEVSAHRSLTDAIAAAQDQDILELRTDGVLPVASLPASDAKRRLTIRAAAGYTPTLTGLQSYSQDIWSLEGLTIGHIVAGRWDGEGFGPIGGVHRLKNCSFTTEQLHQGFRCLADGKEPPAITNCRFFSLHVASAKETTIRFENNVFYKLITGESKSRPGTGNVELSRCTIWGPEPHFHWRDRLGGSFASIQTNADARFTVIDCYFGSPEYLLEILNWQEIKLPFAWTGERNVFSTAHGPLVSYRADTNGLADWTKWVRGESGSFADPPLLMEPRLWKLTPGTPGAGVGPNGTDLGADTTRIAVPSPSTP